MSARNRAVEPPMILVVDEDPQDLQRLANLLREKDYTVIVALTQAQALAKSKENLPDFILMDDGLSGVESPDFCARIKSISKEWDIPVLLLLSAGQSPEKPKKPEITEKSAKPEKPEKKDSTNTDLFSSYACSTIDYLVKPVHPHNLLSVIDLQLKLKHAEKMLSDYQEQNRLESDDRVRLAREKAELKESISEKEQYIERMAIIDDLTGLYNRKYIMEQLASEIAKSRRYAHHLSLILVDIEGMSDINQIHGLPYGDEVLVQISRSLLKGVREVDMVARFGGKTFLILLPHTEVEGAEQTAERLEEAIMEFQWDQYPVPLSVSRGVSTLSPDRMADIGHSNPRNILYHLIMKADDHLYQNKERQRAQAQTEEKTDENKKSINQD